MRRAALIVLAVTLATLAGVHDRAAAATTWVVNGSTGNDVTCTPCKTIGAAMAKAVSGDTVAVQGGSPIPITYQEAVVIPAGVSLLGAGSGRVVIEPPTDQRAIDATDTPLIQGVRLDDEPGDGSTGLQGRKLR